MSIRESFFQVNSGGTRTPASWPGASSSSDCRTSPPSSGQTTTRQLRDDGPVQQRVPQHHLDHDRLRSLETILGVVMALIMSKAFTGRGVVRAGILVPWAIPTIVSALMWKLIFDEAGVANRILGQQILWLADTGASFWAVVIADVWKTAPFIGLLTLAGLQTIPAEVYEAAKVDGATAMAAVRPDHPADGQADPGGRGAVPHPRHAADVRSALRHDRPREVSGGGRWCRNGRRRALAGGAERGGE